jgi:rubrerythrin
MDFKGSRTEQNLKDAFAQESKVRNNYDIYAKKAKEEGFIEIASVFEKTAKNEKSHAEGWFLYLHDGKIPSTLANLQSASKGEDYEFRQMYKEYADVARQEGFTEIASMFDLVGKVEHTHEEKFKTLEQKLQEGNLFKGEDNTVWICQNCGHNHTGQYPPEICPICKKDRGYFQTKSGN